jgi:uncharacterized membrane protein YphA (DoxX/SURF4 family)
MTMSFGSGFARGTVEDQPKVVEDQPKVEVTSEPVATRNTSFALGAVEIESQPAHQAYQILHIAFAALPIIAGADKFFDVLVNWDKYLAPRLAKMSLIPVHHLMWVFGGIEIVAGLIVVKWPRVGAYIVTAWLWLIVLNLLMAPGYYDIVIRDLALSLGALALAKLSASVGREAERVPA